MEHFYGAMRKIYVGLQPIVLTWLSSGFASQESAGAMEKTEGRSKNGPPRGGPEGSQARRSRTSATISKERTRAG